MAFAQGLMLIQGSLPVEAQQLIIDGRTRTPITGPSGSPIQTINDVMATSERLIVVEGETNSLVVLSLDGRTLSRTPNTGPGAAMLGYPIQMTLSGQGELLVLDAQTPRLARFSLHGESVALISVLRLRGITGVTGVCSLRGKTLVLGTTVPTESSSKLVHVIGQDGSVTSSFGDGFGPSSEVSRLLYGAGRVLCLPREGLVVVASKSYPEVRGYDERGNLRWSQTLPEYRQVSYTETAQGSIEYTYPPDNLWDQTVSVFGASEGMVAVQVGRRKGRQPGTPFESIRTMFFSAADGRRMRTQTDLPLVKASSAGRLFSIEERGTLSILSYSVRGQ